MCLHVHLYILMRLAPFLQIHHVVLSTHPHCSPGTRTHAPHTHTPIWTEEPMSGDAMLYPRLPQVPRLCGVRVAACQVICLYYRLVSCVRIALFPGRVSSLSLPCRTRGRPVHWHRTSSHMHELRPAAVVAPWLHSWRSEGILPVGACFPTSFSLAEGAGFHWLRSEAQDFLHLVVVIIAC